MERQYKVIGNASEIIGKDANSGARGYKVIGTIDDIQKIEEQRVEKPLGFNDTIQALASRGFNIATLGFGDEIVGSAAKAITTPIALAQGKNISDVYSNVDRAIEIENEKRERIARENPLASTAFDVATGVVSIGATPLGAGIGRIGKAVEGSKLIPSALKPALATASEGAAVGGIYGAGENGDIGERVKTAATGAVIGGALGGAVGGVGGAIFPKAAEEVIPLAQKAIQTYKIPLSQSQISGGKFSKVIGSVAEDFPYSGSARFKNYQQKAWQRNIAKEFGEDADLITPDVIDNAYKNIGQKFDSLFKGKTLDLTQDVFDRISLLDDQAKLMTNEGYSQFQRNLNNFLSNIDDSGKISGEKLNTIRSNLTKLYRGKQSEAATYLRDLNDIIMDMSVSGDAANRALLNEARAQYRALKTVEPLAEKAINGYISPSLLTGRVSKQYGDFSRGGGGNLGDLARIGKTFLAEKTPNSGTPARLMGLGALFSGAANPVGTIAAAAKAYTAGELFNLFNTNRALVNAALKGAGNIPRSANLSATAATAIDRKQKTLTIGRE